MVELLAAGLTGSPFGFETRANNTKSTPLGVGQVIIAISPSHSGSDSSDMLTRVEQLFSEILSEPGTRLPSERRYRSRLQTPTAGVSVPASLYEELQRIINDGTPRARI
jgi:(2R)-3-sulfolactate dehydrogenase (NADP+)